MRSAEEVRAVFRMADLGLSRSEIARRADLPRSTVRDWLDRGEDACLGRRFGTRAGQCECFELAAVNAQSYAYLLGQYLGDGCISKIRKTYRLRLAWCDAYPQIKTECASAVTAVKGRGRVGAVQRVGNTELWSYWMHWPCLLPHGEGGPKPQRRIELDGWQVRLAVEGYPGRLLGGLIHSDGWRGTNRVTGANGRLYEYTRYQFSNTSEDILSLFGRACQQLGVEARRMNRVTAAVSRREDVAVLDEHVGPKA
jgi:hypothetical protein